jgi:hypothetical protein
MHLGYTLALVGIFSVEARPGVAPKTRSRNTVSTTLTVLCQFGAALMRVGSASIPSLVMRGALTVKPPTSVYVLIEEIEERIFFHSKKKLAYDNLGFYPS